MEGGLVRSSAALLVWKLRTRKRGYYGAAFPTCDAETLLFSSLFTPFFSAIWKGGYTIYSGALEERRGLTRGCLETPAILLDDIRILVANHQKKPVFLYSWFCCFFLCPFCR